MTRDERRKWPVTPVRRLSQILVLLVLVLVPLAGQQPGSWSPSRIVQGQLPEPVIFPVTGDTWSFAIGDYQLVHPVAFLENWASAKRLYLPLLTAALLPLAMTLLLGRFFCSWICPVGFLLELNAKANRWLSRHGMTFSLRVPDFRYPFFTLCLALGFLFAFPLISVFDPPHVLGRELMYIFTHQQFSLTGMGLLLAIFLFELLAVSRVWCSSLCPSGGGLSLLGRWRLWRIALDREKCLHCEGCDHACPYRLAPMNLAEGKKFDWTKCDNCGLCRDACPTGAITYGCNRIISTGIKGGR